MIDTETITLKSHDITLDNFEGTENETPDIEEEEKKQDKTTSNKDKGATGTESDESDEESTEDDYQDDEEESEDSEEDSEEGEQEFAYSNKEILVKSGGKVIKLDDDSEIKIKVNGEVQTIKIKDYKNIVAGEMSVEQRVGKASSAIEDAKKYKQQYKDKIEAFDSFVPKMVELAKEDPFKAIMFLSEEAGLDSIVTFKKMLGESIRQAKTFQGWNEEQIENHFNKLKLAKYQEQEKNNKTLAEQQQQDYDLVNRIYSQGDSIGLSSEELDQTSNELVQQYGDEFFKLDQSERGKLILTETIHKKNADIILQGIQKTGINYSAHEDFFTRLSKVVDYREYNVDDIVVAIETYLEQESKLIGSSLSKKINHKESSKKQDGNSKKDSKITLSSRDRLENLFDL